MTNRNQWKFRYSSEELLTAVQDKLKHHRSRHEWWKTERERIMKEITTKGLTIHDSLAANGQFSTSNYVQQPTVMIDQELSSDLHECNIKIPEHTNHIKAYEAWEEILGQETGSFDLDADDWEFFFSKR